MTWTRPPSRPRRPRLQVAPGAGDRAAGADARDEVGHPAVGVGPDLGSGASRSATLRPHRVGVLVRLPRAVDLADQPVGRRVVGVRVVGRDGGRADHDLGAVGLEHVALVLAHLVGADEHALVAPALGHERQADTGVAGRRLDDGAAGLELAGGLGGLDHLERDAVLHRPARVHVLDLGQDRGGDPRPVTEVELDEGRVPDEVGDVLCVLHRTHPLRCWTCHRTVQAVTGRISAQLVDAVPAPAHHRGGRGTPCQRQR